MHLPALRVCATGERPLKSLIWRALELAKVSTYDVIRVSRRGGLRAKGECVLTKQDFVKMVGRMLRTVHRDVWRSEIVPIAEQIFGVVSGKHDNIGGTLSKKVRAREHRLHHEVDRITSLPVTR